MAAFSLSAHYEDEGERMDECDYDGENTVISLYYARRVSKPVNLNIFTIPQLQSLLFSMVGEQYLEIIRTTTEKKKLIEHIESVILGDERFQVPPRQEFANNIPFNEIAQFIVEGNKIGKGKSGQIYHGEWHHTRCAIKKISSVSPGMAALPGIRLETEAMRFPNPYICSLLGVSFHDDAYFIVMDLMAGSLDEYLRNNPTLDPFRRLDIIDQVQRALLWLHRQRPTIIHLDLKLENILHDHHGVIKLSDFGLSAILPANKKYIMADRTIGNLAHMAPEIMRLNRFNHKADIYGFAVLMWEIMKGIQWSDVLLHQMQSHGIQIPPLITSESQQEFYRIFKTNVVAGLRPPMDANQLVVSVKEGPVEYSVYWPSKFIFEIQNRWCDNPSERLELDQMNIGKLKHEFLRKSLEFILHRDEKAQKYWLEHQRLSNPDGIASLGPIPWNTFCETFFSHFHHDDLHQDATFMKCFAAAFGIRRNAKPVTLDMYANVCVAFGPLNDFDSFIVKLKTTACAEWFHPEKSLEDAESLLDKQVDGAFLVRYSHACQVPFSITYVNQRAIFQIRVKKTNNKLFVDSPTLKDLYFDSLPHLIADANVKKTLNLQTHFLLSNAHVLEDSLPGRGYVPPERVSSSHEQ